MVKYWGRTFTLLGVVCRCCNQCGRWQWRPRHLRKSPPPWFSDFSFEMKALLQWIIIKNRLFDIVRYMSNCDNHSLKYKIISGDLSNFIWSFIFLTFVLCVLVGCLLDHTLLPHSGSLSRLLLGWIHIIVLCIPGVGSPTIWLLLSRFLLCKLTTRTHSDQKYWHGPKYYFPSKWHWSGDAIIELNPKEILIPCHHFWTWVLLSFQWFFFTLHNIQFSSKSIRNYHQEQTVFFYQLVNI